MVVLTNTIIDNGRMMVESLNTLITEITMARSFGFEHFTVGT